MTRLPVRVSRWSRANDTNDAEPFPVPSFRGRGGEELGDMELASRKRMVRRLATQHLSSQKYLTQSLLLSDALPMQDACVIRSPSPL